MHRDEVTITIRGQAVTIVSTIDPAESPVVIGIDAGLVQQISELKSVVGGSEPPPSVSAPAPTPR